jgi:hypothetical protein
VKAALAATGDPVLINEVFATHTGTSDDTEYIELLGNPGANLDGLSLIVVEGEGSSKGRIDRQIDFGPVDVIGANGFYLAGNPNGLGSNYGVTPNFAFDTIRPNSVDGPGPSFTIQDTAGCSCSQIIDALHLGRGHAKLGCSIGIMQKWVRRVNSD